MRSRWTAHLLETAVVALVLAAALLVFAAITFGLLVALYQPGLILPAVGG